MKDEWLAALHSLIIASASALLSTAIALAVAYVLWRCGMRCARALFALGIAPYILPPVIMALAFLLFSSSVGINGMMSNVIIAHAVFPQALPLVTVLLALESVDRGFMEAAQTMSASGWSIFRTVIAPIATPFALAGLHSASCSA